MVASTRLSRLCRGCRVGLGFLGCAAAFVLSGCQTPREPEIRTVRVEIPVPVKCAADPGPRPDYPDTDAAIAGAPNIFELAKLYRAGRALRIAREGQLEASVSGCR